MKIALFAGHNRLARTFSRLLTRSPNPPLAVFRPTFADSSRLSKSTKRPSLAVSVAGSKSVAHDEEASWLSSEPDGPVLVHAGEMNSQVRQQLSRFKPELIVSVCWPYRLPGNILDLASAGGLNLHPSPLPAWRGNDPIFWQLRAGCAEIGLSLHQMTQVLDAGFVVARDSIAVTNGMSDNTLDQKIAQHGTALLLNYIGTGSGETAEIARRRGVARGNYFTAPVEQDYRFWTSWSGAHAERFVRILRPRGHRFQVSTPAGYFTVRDMYDDSRHDAKDRRVLQMADAAVAFVV